MTATLTLPDPTLLPVNNLGYIMEMLSISGYTDPPSQFTADVNIVRH